MSTIKGFALFRGYLNSLFIGLIFLSLVCAQKATAQSYDYPYHDSFVATASYALLKSDTRHSKEYSEVLYPERMDIPLLKGRAHFSFTLYKQKQPAPLVFLLPGLGGHYLLGASPFLAEQFFKQGYHVIALTSPFHWSFVLSSSESAMPGMTDQDAKDIYRNMRQALEIAKKRSKIKVSKLALVGWSLGALEAGFIAELASREQNPPLDMTVLINPPASLLYGATQLDMLMSLAPQLTADQLGKLQGQATTTIGSLLERDINDPDYFYGLEKYLPFSTQELRLVVGSYFRGNLADTIFTTQQIRDMGILKHQDLNDRYRISECKAFGFTDYIARFVIPFYEKHLNEKLTIQSLDQRSSLGNVAGFLNANEKVFLFHNEDDFLITAQDIGWFKELFGNRARFYPRGGHLGNLWYPQNQSDLISVVDGVLKN